MNELEPRMVQTMGRELEPAPALPNFLSHLTHVIRSDQELAVITDAHAHFFMRFFVELRRVGIFRDLNKTEFDVICTLLEALDVKRCSDEELITYPISEAHIAEHCGHWRGSVGRAIDELMLFGIAVVHAGGRGRVNEYRLRIPPKHFHKKLPRAKLVGDTKVARARRLKLCRHGTQKLRLRGTQKLRLRGITCRTGTAPHAAQARQVDAAQAQLLDSGNILREEEDNNASSSPQSYPQDDVFALSLAEEEMENVGLGERRKQEMLSLQTPTFIIAACLLAQSKKFDDEGGFVISAVRGDGRAEVSRRDHDRAVQFIARKQAEANRPAAMPNAAGMDPDAKPITPEQVAELKRIALQSREATS